MAKNTQSGFLAKLGEMHRAEQELTVALPLVEAAAKSQDLKDLLNIHLSQTKGHVRALEDVATHLGCELPSQACLRMTRLIGNAVRIIGKRLVSSEQDAALIEAGRRIEQFEIEQYEELCAEARSQQLTHTVALLTSILNQEQMADELLAEVAAGHGPAKTLVEQASLRRAGVLRAAAQHA